jgi:hypothetical protein
MVFMVKAKYKFMYTKSVVWVAAAFCAVPKSTCFSSVEMTFVTVHGGGV